MASRTDWLKGHAVALAGLLLAATAMVAGALGRRAAHNAREAGSATARMRRLFELTQRTLEMDLHVEPGQRLASLVHEIFELEAVAVFDADLHEVYEAGDWSVDPREMAQNVYHFETSDDDPSTGISRRVIRLGSVPIGSLVARGDAAPLTNSAIAALIAITFDRYRATANESRIEAERQAEQMRAAVLDNLAHAYKTPLTAIRAASSGLCEVGQLSPAQAGLVALIDEQATALSDLTTRLLTTARLEAGHAEEGAASVTLRLATESVGSLIEDVVASVADRSSGIHVVIDLPDEGLVLDCDRHLVAMLLEQYLDNACKYADFDSTVTVRATQVGQEIIFAVRSFGPVIPLAHRDRIFDRYFRSSGSPDQPAGTGIGLSIAKRVAMAHGGSVWVSSDEVEGTTFFAAIPLRAPVSATRPAAAHNIGLKPDGSSASLSPLAPPPHPCSALERILP
jgi:two-component system sensor histidine kinase KdpD